MPQTILDHGISAFAGAAGGAGALWGVLKAWAKYSPAARKASSVIKEQGQEIRALKERMTTLESKLQKTEDAHDFLIRAGRKAYLAFSTGKTERGMAFLEIFEDPSASKAS